MHYKEWIPQAVKGLRGDKTLKTFSEDCGVSIPYLSDIENGRTIPTLETLDKIFISQKTTLTLGFAKDYEPPNYVYIKRADIEVLKTIVGRWDVKTTSDTD